MPLGNSIIFKMKKYDILIVGAGIIGLTLVLRLKEKYPNAKIAILEKEDKLGMHASGRNSGVLHSGVYYDNDSLKAKLCSKGAMLMRAFASENNIKCNKSGKVIIATNDQEVKVIDQLYLNACKNKIKVTKITEDKVRKIEPYAGVHKYGLYINDTAVIDSKGVIDRLYFLLKNLGVHFFLKNQVVNIDEKIKVVTTNCSKVSYGFLFNCAGAYADQIARTVGLSTNYRLIPFKGIYHKLSHEKNYLVNSNIYPVPDMSLPFLGVHLTRVASGDVYVGPTAIPAFGRENYGILNGISLNEGMITAWELSRMYLSGNDGFRQLAHHEFKKYLKKHFVESAKILVPDIRSQDLIESSKVGIRPQLINIKTRKLEMDFIVEQTSSSIHVLNAVSPAFTCSFSFADMLCEKYEGIN